MRLQAPRVRRAVNWALVLAAQALARAGAQVPSDIQVTPVAFAGADKLKTFLGYAMYAAWLFVFGLIVYAVFEMREGVLSEGVKRALGGAIGAAFLLTFGWAIISGVFGGGG